MYIYCIVGVVSLIEHEPLIFSIVQQLSDVIVCCDKSSAVVTQQSSINQRDGLNRVPPVNGHIGQRATKDPRKNGIAFPSHLQAALATASLRISTDFSFSISNQSLPNIFLFMSCISHENIYFVLFVLFGRV